MNVSLIDLAKLLEKDLLIFEYEKDKYKLAFKTEMLGNHSMNITINEDIESLNQQDYQISPKNKESRKITVKCDNKSIEDEPKLQEPTTPGIEM